MPFYKPDGRLHYYAHVPKCAGISVEAHLEARFGDLGFRDDDYNRRWPERSRWSRSSPQHILWRDLTRIVPESWIASVFTVVRHPAARLVSAFNFQATKARTIPPGLTIDAWFEDYLALRESYPFDHDNHLVPQSDFAPASAVFFRLEDGLAAVSDWLDERFGAGGGDGIGHMNESAPDEARFTEEEGISDALAARIDEVYAEDFARYGYEPAPARPLVVRYPVSAPGSFQLKRRRAQKRLRHRFRSLLS